MNQVHIFDVHDPRAHVRTTEYRPKAPQDRRFKASITNGRSVSLSPLQNADNGHGAFVLEARSPVCQCATKADLIYANEIRTPGSVEGIEK